MAPPVSDASCPASREGSSTSSGLLRQVRSNDAEAWRRLVDLYGPLVWHWCRQSDLNVDDQADVFQEVFRAVFRGVGDFRRDATHGTFRGWLLVITQNQIRDQFRRKINRPAAAGGTDAYQRLLAVANPDEDETRDSTGHHPVTALLHRALETIRPEFEDRTWRAFWRAAVDGENSSTVAAEMEMTAGAVRKAKARVLSRLRGELGDLE